MEKRFHFVSPKSWNLRSDAAVMFLRLLCLPNADRIIVLDQGQIVQEGIHEKLVREPGYYQEFYNQQLLEKEH